jgi:hypothetical protein
MLESVNFNEDVIVENRSQNANVEDVKTFLKNLQILVQKECKNL